MLMFSLKDKTLRKIPAYNSVKYVDNKHERQVLNQTR